MESAVDYIHEESPDRSIDIWTIAGRVTMNAISLSIFGEGLTDNINEGNWEARPKYACMFEPGMNVILQLQKMSLANHKFEHFSQLSPLGHGCCACHLRV